MHQNTWEIENIEIKIDNEAAFLRKFVIYDDSNLIQAPLFNIVQTTDFVKQIKNSGISTGIMVSNMKINNILIYLFILDDKIFIIKQINLSKFQEYFKEHMDSLIFNTPECKDNFSKDIFSEDQISYQQDQILKDQQHINESIKKEIILSTIKKSQYRTIKMRNEILPNKYNSKNKDYKIDDFISIQSRNFKLRYNSKDQILNVLKSYDDEKRFNHEINFYHQIENTFPFIRKIYGIIKQTRVFPIIILEYVEGDRLDNFLLSTKEIGFNTKIKIIEEILFSVYYIHCNGFYLRDLKPGNIIINSMNNAILIDFDSSKEMYSEEEENTCNIGSFVYTAPEQSNSNKYTYKVDSYSIGMIIHFIITRQKFNFNYDDLSEISNKKENISKTNNFPKLPQEYEFILNIYEKCFEVSPNSRPSITTLINKMIFQNSNTQLKSVNETEIPHIINELEKYESIFKIADKYMHEKPAERSYLQFFLGIIYYYGEYVSPNINKSIGRLEKSPDINKSIHYFTLSSNQNNSDAQYFLGEINYFGKYISRDINKSFYYLTLSAYFFNDSYVVKLLDTFFTN